jgi:hypothetical protein
VRSYTIRQTIFRPHTSRRPFERFRFQILGPHKGLHAVTRGYDGREIPSTLILSVPAFCADIRDAGYAWLAAVEHDEAIQARIRATIKIHPENGIDPGRI